MKQRSLLTILFCLLAGFASASTVMGVVMNASSNPVPNQVVYATDSNNNYLISDTTDALGQYNMTLPGSVTIGSQIKVWTGACGQIYSSYYVYAGANITSNFNICGTSASNTLQGYVTLPGTTIAGYPAWVFVISATYNPATSDWTLALIDSLQTNNNGFYSHTYASIPGGNLLLKAALRPSCPSYASFLPTYYTSSLIWSGGLYLTASNFAPNTFTNIPLIAGTNPGGFGFVGGLVSQGANKGTGVGDPLTGRALLLTTSTGQAVAYTYSNAAGQFSFPNLAYGTYKIFGDAWGLQNPALSVTISATQPSIGNVIFEENSTMFHGHIGGLGVGQVSGVLSHVGIYPNPAADQVQLIGLDAIRGSKTIVLSNMSGAIITRQNIPDGQTSSIPTASLPAGIYLLQLYTESGNVQFKLTK